MAVGFGINKSSLMAQRRLGEATSQNSRLSEQLASGLRINRASDDAAGLAISSALNSSSKVYAQGIRNLNDGISLLSVADSAISALSEITTRLSELASQASNGSYSSTQRSALDSEAQALSKEYTRIIQSTKFNNISVIGGDLASGLRLQAGYGTEGGISSNLGGAQGTATFTTQKTTTSSTGMNDLALGDFDNDGDLDMISLASSDTRIYKNDGSGNFTLSSSVSSGISTGQKAELIDINNDGNLDMLVAGITGSNIMASVRLGNGDGTFGSATVSTITSGTGIAGFAVGDMDNDGKMDLVAMTESGIPTLRVARGDGNGNFTPGALEAVESNFPLISSDLDSLQLGDVNGDGKLDIVIANGGYYIGAASLRVRLGTGTGSFGSVVTSTIFGWGATSGASFKMADFDNDGKLDAVVSFGASANSYVMKGNGNGTFSVGQSLQYLNNSSYNMETADLNGDGFLDIISLGFDDGYVAIRTGRGDGTFNATISTTGPQYGSALAVGDINKDGVADLVIGEAYGGDVFSYKNVTRNAASPLLNFSLKTRADAKYAQSLFSQKLNQLSEQRGQIGAFLSRTEVAINSLTNIREQYNTASSRILDVDVASAAGEYLRTQILQNAATAVLAQANQSPQIGLRLLENVNKD